MDEKSQGLAPHWQRQPSRDRLWLAVVLTLALTAPYLFTAQSALPRAWGLTSKSESKPLPHVADRFKHNVERCQWLDTLPGPPEDFDQRTENDRYIEGTPVVHIKNATIWTGEKNGHEVIQGDVILDKGLIQQVGKVDLKGLTIGKTVDAHGAWLTPGIFDMHSHIGVESLPHLDGAQDGNSLQKPVLPYLRSLDGINTHDLSLKRTVSGGVTTSLILPGSANNEGGQAFVIKLGGGASGVTRGKGERKGKGALTPQSMVLEMPAAALGKFEPGRPRWRHMKMACGENIRRVYSQTRLDLAWNFRSSFEKARAMKKKQDDFCARALAKDMEGGVLDEDFPEELEWESLVDLLRGKIKLNVHCYESTDLDAFVRHTNEFKFPVAAFHHAHETFMVPDLLKTAWNNTPAVAIFATNARYKREAWRGSEYAPKIHADNNITVVMKSDHPVLDSRFLLYEAQQAHHFGLAENLALASVTTSPAVTAGFGHRLGHVRVGKDADIVLWDSHPLKLGATPLQVFIDGIPQLEQPFPAKKAEVSSAPVIASVPEDPITLRSDDDEVGLVPGSRKLYEEILFTNVMEVVVKKNGDLRQLKEGDGPVDVLARGSEIVCIGSCASQASSSTKRINLKNGSLLPSFTAFGPALGLTEIIAEKSTSDNPVYDPLMQGELSRVQQLWGPRIGVKAVDGLSLGGKHLKIAHAGGIGQAVTAPMGNGFFRGVSVAFRTGAEHVLEKGALIKDVVALHVTLGHYKLTQRASISTQIGELRALLRGDGPPPDSGFPDYFAMAGRGEIPLVLNVWKADTIAALIRLKEEIEGNLTGGKKLRWVLHGGQEAHVVADALAAADVGVILSPPRSIPESWDERRSLAGPPLTQYSAPVVLHRAGVKVALGVPEEWQAMHLRWEAAWAQRNSDGQVRREDAIAWISTNLDELLDLPDTSSDFVAYERDPFEFGSRPVARSSTVKEALELIEE